ncbi:MAG TPA: adenosylmethionine--8-amino-7-oxononanoate transaminase [Gemmataceae bacterium]|jgi:adenosylmethionine-8-amino-7-oxononanoate aminotransferase|nr:adenosylmethionine--8-amino-7-oxononanoate transaminase [Gemmataceae bacterium]
MDATRQQLEQWDRDHVWHPFTAMEAYAAEPPLIIERAHGCFLVDLDGREYLDGVSSLWCNVHGHQVPELDQAVRQQLDRVAHSTLLGLANVPSVLLARRLVELAPCGLTRVFFSDDGATAVEVALKMAFQYWRQRPAPRPRKTQFLALQGAYHGDTLGDVSVGDLERFHRLFGPLLFPTVRAPSPYCYRCPLGLQRATCHTDCADVLASLVEQHADTLAAVVIEPLVQGAAGMITAPPGYLRRVREVTRAHDVLLIADEVAVGFGRTGTLFACAQENVAPDFLCLAKGLTGGYLPLAATLTTEEVFGAFLGRPEEGRTFYHGHTYTGNPLGAAAALANLELLETAGTLAAVPGKAERLRLHLQRLAALPHVGDVRQRGLMAGVELVRDKATRQPFPAAQRMGAHVCRMARDRGVLLRPLGDVVVIMPPLAIDLSLLDCLCDVLYNCLSSFVPCPP